MEKERQNYIRKAFEEIQIFLNEEQIQQFACYYEILIQKNEVMNLTAITEFEDVVRKHFVDSLTIKNILEDILQQPQTFSTDNQMKMIGL